MTTPYQKNPMHCGRPSVGHHYYMLDLSDLSSGVGEKILNFTLFIPKLSPLVS